MKMATHNNDNKILNAIRLHLVLLNVANEASQYKLIELIQTYRGTSVKDFLIYVCNEIRSNPPEHLKGFFATLKKNSTSITRIHSPMI